MCFIPMHICVILTKTFGVRYFQILTIGALRLQFSRVEQFFCSTSTFSKLIFCS